MAYIVDGPEELAGELLGGRLFLTRLTGAIEETIFNRGARGVSPRPVHSCCFVGRCFRGLVNSFSDCFKKLF